MTRVEEWTNADTGVGAAIAAGNQAENGIWALLVLAAIKSVNINKLKLVNAESHNKNIKFQEPNFKVNLILIKIKISPIRLLRAVISPAFMAFLLWKKTTSKYEVTPSPSHPNKMLIKLGLKIKINIELTKARIVKWNRK